RHFNFCLTNIVNFTIACEKLIGNPTAQGWVVTHDFTPINPKLVAEKGRLITLISMAGKADAAPPTKENQIIGNEILTRLQEVYFGKVGNPIELLKSGIEKIEKDFKTPN